MSQSQKLHFISIGGSVMHNLAIALHLQGNTISGSDDGFFEPSKSNLSKYGLLPQTTGWDDGRITEDLDGVILGMHAKEDNPELLKARELGVPIFSFPEYVFKASQDKQRIVIAGSHGKTSITAMIMHVLQHMGKEFDYLVGAPVKGFDISIQLTDAPIIIIEGDEYLTSPLDRVPKFLKYEHHIALISGIDWDHVNVYPTYDEYVQQFDLLADRTPKGGTIIFNEEDNLVKIIGSKGREDVRPVEYATHAHRVVDGQTFLLTDQGEIPVEIFGKHNMQNLAGALALVQRIGVTADQFYEAIQTFEGAQKRLELLASSEGFRVFKDFAHAPSKVAATCKAVKNQFPDETLIGVLELHTFSSLNKKFLPQYKGTLSKVDRPLVFVSEESLKAKGLVAISLDELRSAFENERLQLLTSNEDLKDHLMNEVTHGTNLLFMSSGDFDGLDLVEISQNLLKS